MVIGLLGIVAFLLAERHYGDDALLPLRLFRGRTFGIGSLLNFILGMGMFGGLAALPLYLQIVKGASPTQAGLLLLPLTAGIMAGSIFAGQVITRTGRYKKFPVIGVRAAGRGPGHAVDDRRRHAAGLHHGLRRAVRPRARLQHAAARARRAERRAAAGHGRGHLVGDVLPPDGRHAGHRGLPVDPVLDGGGQDHRRLPGRGADPGLPGGAAGPGGGRRPGQRQDPRGAAVRRGRRRPCRPARWTTRRSFPDLDDRLARPFLVGFSASMDLVFRFAAMVLVLAFVVVLFLPEEKLRTRVRHPGPAAAAGRRGRRSRGGRGQPGVGAVEPDGRRRGARRTRRCRRLARR